MSLHRQVADNPPNAVRFQFDDNISLNDAEMSPGAPQVSSMRRRESGIRSHCPMKTTGPMRPVEPPLPMQTADPSVLTAESRGRRRPARSRAASIASATPAPDVPRWSRRVSGP